MQAKNETSDCVLLDPDIYFALIDSLYEAVDKLEKIRNMAQGWKDLNGAHRAYGDTILRILDNQT
jgi:hypothetical protein